MNVTKKTVKKAVTTYKKQTMVVVEMTERQAKIIEIAFGSMGTNVIADAVSPALAEPRHKTGDSNTTVSCQEVWDIWAAFDKCFKP